jgi:hypothetical protein
MDMNSKLSSIAVFAALWATALAAILLIAAAASAQDRQGANAPLVLAQSDEAPMVISPHPAQGQVPRYEDGPPPPPDAGGPGRPYEAPLQAGNEGPYVPPEAQDQGSFSMDEINETGHRFFDRVSMGFAKAVEYTFQRAGRPNGYILGEEAGGAFIAGLRYGEGTLYTKDAGDHKVYWQGPSIGYDFGGEGSKTMVLVYNLQSPGEIYRDYAGVDGSAYLVGGVGVTFLTRDHVVLAPIRSGLGLRLGANIGYLKYSREPTWNPF